MTDHDSAATPGYDPSAFREVFENHFTYEAGFRRNVDRFAGRTALTDPDNGRSWTYAELGVQVDRLAAGLRARGLRGGDVVLYQLFNSPEFALCYLATQRAGVIGSPVNFRLAAGEVGYILDDSRPKIYVYDTELTEVVRQALELAEHQPDMLVAVGGGEPLAGAIAFADLAADSEPGLGVGALHVPGQPPYPPTYRETTRLYTSGTPGMPKGVALNSLVEVLSAHDVIMHFPLGPTDKTLNMTPWFHRGGLYSGGPNPLFYVGASAVVLRQFDPGRVLDLVQQEGLTFLIGAPTNLARLADAQEAQARDLSTLRGIVTMGAPLERDAALRYQRLLTPRIFNGYGTTEAFWNTFLRPEDLPDGAGSAGRSCTDDDVAVVHVYPDRIADPDDVVARDGVEVGEVAVRSVKSGYAYLNQPDEQQAKFRDGWLYAGDLASWDAEGLVTIIGRKDDMITSGGENVHPVQVEEVLNRHPQVADSVVVGLPDPEWGELVVAYLVAHGEAPSTGDLEKHCLADPMLANYKRPRLYGFVDEVPLTATGKKIHYQMRDLAIADQAAGLLVRP